MSSYVRLTHHCPAIYQCIRTCLRWSGTRTCPSQCAGLDSINRNEFACSFFSHTNVAFSELWRFLSGSWIIRKVNTCTWRYVYSLTLYWLQSRCHPSTRPLSCIYVVAPEKNSNFVNTLAQTMKASDYERHYNTLACCTICVSATIRLHRALYPHRYKMILAISAYSQVRMWL
jgi:hypothetical protein